MSWLYESFSIKSAKNGRINCSRRMGKWTVKVDGFYETSPYTNDMWQQTLSLLPPFDIYKNVLLLGLGAGGIIPLINELFPSAKITAVEWDPAMIQLAKKLKIVKNPERINIIEADALKTVETFAAKGNEKFDLIIVDLFKGGDLDKSLSQIDFFQNLKKILRNTGYLLVNAFREPDKITRISNTFLLSHAIKFKYNYLGVFQPPLPDGYLHQRQYRAYLEREAKIRKAISFIQGGKDLGLRATFGPLKVDHFFSDNEPEQKKEGLRIVTWQRITRQDRPRGWHRSWTNTTKRMGFADLNDGEYWEHWTDHAKRHREKWLKQRDEWEVYEPTPEEFIKAYKPSKKDRVLTTLYSGLLRDKLKGHGSLIRLFGIRKPGSTKLEAGFACLDIPEANQSLHFISFIYKSARRSPLGVGLMDEWLKSLQTRGIRFADFGTFWAPKDPRAWLGFSRFKAQFNIRFIDYPRNLWRIGK